MIFCGLAYSRYNICLLSLIWIKQKYFWCNVFPFLTMPTLVNSCLHRHLLNKLFEILLTSKTTSTYNNVQHTTICYNQITTTLYMTFKIVNTSTFATRELVMKNMNTRHHRPHLFIFILYNDYNCLSMRIKSNFMILTTINPTHATHFITRPVVSFPCFWLPVFNCTVPAILKVKHKI